MAFFTKKSPGKGQAAQPLRVEGIGPAPMTAEPDDAELAAQALLESIREISGSRFKIQGSNLKPQTSNPKTQTAEYYHQLAERIRYAREASRIRVLRFITVVEHELRQRHLPLTGEGSLQLLEAELYKRIDIVEHIGGEVKKRWQHCLAEVTVRMMSYGATE